MKKLVKVEEVDGEGLLGFLNKRVILMCGSYFYEGILEGVNDTFVKLLDAHIVFETGPFTDKSYKDRQKLNSGEWYVTTQSIESFGLSKLN